MKFITDYNKYRPVTTMPRQVANGGLATFCVALLAVSLWFYNQAFPWYLWLFGIISVMLFFMGSASYTRKWEHVSMRTFKKHLILTAFIIRAIFVIFINYYNWAHFDTYWGVGSTDVIFYVPEAWEAAEHCANGDWGFYGNWIRWGVDVSDTGYMTYLVIVYLLTFRISDVIIPLLLKALWGALTCWLLYRVVSRHFGEATGRMAGIFAMVYPSFIWWCGSMMKETEMILLMMVYVDVVDSALSEKKMPIGKLIFALLWGTSMFTFRTILGVVAYLALLTAVVFSSSRIVSWGKKLLFGVLVMSFVGVAMSDRLVSTISKMSENAQSGTEAAARNTVRAHTNSFAKYATTTLMAPLIFTVPFPSLVYTSFNQEQSMQRSGANYVKNILSFFVIIVAFIMLLSREWRQHVFPIAFMIGYLIVLVFSSFAHSGRFHLPAEPFEIMFASYGISLMNNPKYKRWFTYALIIEFTFILVWNYVKLKGRGYV